MTRELGGAAPPGRAGQGRPAGSDRQEVDTKAGAPLDVLVIGALEALRRLRRRHRCRPRFIVVVGVTIGPDGQRYFDIHHTEADTLDKVQPEDLGRNAAAVALLGYVIAER